MSSDEKKKFEILQSSSKHMTCEETCHCEKDEGSMGPRDSSPPTSCPFHRSRHRLLPATKQYLMVAERTSLMLRLQVVDEGVNRMVIAFAGQMQSNARETHPTPPSLRLSGSLRTNTFLGFIEDWRGLTKPQETLEAYKKEAKSWMNGRRAAAYRT